jgi:putative ABC transport system permease protein
MKFGERLRSRLWRGSVDDEVDAELEFHVEMRTRELVAKGMEPARARAAAIQRFGNINRVNASCRREGRRRDREMRRTEYLSELAQDVSFAFRQLLHNPGYTLVAVITLALGIGGTAAIFSAVNAVVLRPLPVPEPDRILSVYRDWRAVQGNVSAGNFVHGITTVSAFSATTAMQYSSFNLADAEDAERIIGARTTSGFFDVFATAPQSGRVYTLGEDQPGREHVVVLSNRLWTRRFDSDPSIVGKTIRLNGRPHEVIGIMPAHFDFGRGTAEVWVPIAFTPERKVTFDEHYLLAYGRLKAEATVDQALAELQRNAADLRVRAPLPNADLAFGVTGIMDQLVGSYRERLFVMLGAVGFVLLIACGNAANLLLARGAARSGELAMRAALGAGRGRIVRQLFTESLVLALIAGTLGLLLAWWGVRALIAAAPPGVPRLEQTAIDPVVLAFTLGVTLASAVLFGLAPAVRAARTDIQAVLKEGGRGASTGGVRDRLRAALIVGELALVLMLLVGAGLLIRSAIALDRTSPGFEPNGLLAARLSLPAADYNNPERVVNTFERIVEAARAVPGVTSAALTSQVPMGPGGNSNGLIPEGRPVDPKEAIDSQLRIVTPGYFETLDIPILRGRSLDDADRTGALKVMVISEALANAAFPGENPIGRRIACCEAGPDGKSPDYKVVVGVAGNVRWRGLGEAPYPEFYLPAAQVPGTAWNWIQRTMYVVVRTPMDPMTVANPLRSALAPVVPGVPLFDARTMEQRVGASIAAAKFNTLLLSTLGAIGLVLAAVGIYGVIAFFVSRRTQEIGVRVALGATRRDVIGLVVRQAAGPVMAGITLGIVASFPLARLLQEQLFGVTPHDPVTFAAVTSALACIAFLAALVPARRAASVDPTRALHGN